MCHDLFVLAFVLRWRQDEANLRGDFNQAGFPLSTHLYALPEPLLIHT